ncbi:Histone-lysine N-methyltransferase SETMAR, partial [Habropoda laboriosa]
DILPHPYSRDLSPTDYYFFEHLNNVLTNKLFLSEDTVKTVFQEFLNSKTNDIYSWQKGVESCRNYFD